MKNTLFPKQNSKSLILTARVLSATQSENMKRITNGIFLLRLCAYTVSSVAEISMRVALSVGAVETVFYPRTVLATGEPSETPAHLSRIPDSAQHCRVPRLQSPRISHLPVPSSDL